VTCDDQAEKIVAHQILAEIDDSAVAILVINSGQQERCV
jgi:hypothetical protein